MSEDSLKKEFVAKYLADGDDKFYRFLLAHALKKLISIEKGQKSNYPNIDFINYYDRFMILFRREGDPVLFQLAKIFRKAAHKIYRVMLKKKLTAVNAKFLNLV